MSPAQARALTPGTPFRYAGIVYLFAELYVSPKGLFLVPERLDMMFPAAQCDALAPARRAVRRRPTPPT